MGFVRQLTGQAAAEEAQMRQISYQIEAAAKQQDTATKLAAIQTKAAQQNQQQQQQFEASRTAAAAEFAAGSENQKLTSAAPTVQLADQGTDSSAASARKRRAVFRPDYQSGVTI
jgi:hypothetical protein